jgi:hypothetical protein
MRCLQRSVGLQRAQYAPSLQPACVHPAKCALRAADDQLEQDLEAELDALDDMVMNRPANKGRDQVCDLLNLSSRTKFRFMTVVTHVSVQMHGIAGESLWCLA